jgi:hypothetical protein
MTTNSTLPLPVRPRTGRELRLSLTPGGPRSRLNGAWWPHSRDLSAELPHLIAELDGVWGRITRAAVHGPTWAGLCHDVPTGAHDVRVNWYDAAQDRNAISLFSYRIGHWELLVVPPGNAPWRADQLMAAASRPGNQRSADSLLADGHMPADIPQRDRIRIRTRRTHGPPSPVPPAGAGPSPARTLRSLRAGT